MTSWTELSVVQKKLALRDIPSLTFITSFLRHVAEQVFATL